MEPNEPKTNKFGCGDCFLILNFLPPNLAVKAFVSLRDEVSFSEMTLKSSAVPRLVAIQGDLTDNFIEPVYRHPNDVQPALTTWTPTMLEIRNILNERMGQDCNHSLVQLYRSGEDNISPHSDKTLDITGSSSILTLSFGAMRTLILRSKEDKPGHHLDSTLSRKEIVRIPLPTNSLFVLGSETNKRYLHSIKADKRPLKLKSPEELSCDGQRISLTFRSIATFYNRCDGSLTGQGAPKKMNPTETLGQTAIDHENNLDVNAAVHHGSDDDSEIERMRLIEAFSAENRQADFDWDLHYGKGFSSLNKTE